AKCIEDVGEERLRDGRTLIVDLHPDLFFRAAEADGDRRSRLAMRDRVAHQVRDHLRRAFRIEPGFGPSLRSAAQLYVGMQHLQYIEILLTDFVKVAVSGRDWHSMAL